MKATLRFSGPGARLLIRFGPLASPSGRASPNCINYESIWSEASILRFSSLPFAQPSATLTAGWSEQGVGSAAVLALDNPNKEPSFSGQGKLAKGGSRDTRIKRRPPSCGWWRFAISRLVWQSIGEPVEPGGRNQARPSAVGRTGAEQRREQGRAGARPPRNAQI